MALAAEVWFYRPECVPSDAGALRRTKSSATPRHDRPKCLYVGRQSSIVLYLTKGKSCRCFLLASEFPNASSADSGLPEPEGSAWLIPVALRPWPWTLSQDRNLRWTHDLMFCTTTKAMTLAESPAFTEKPTLERLRMQDWEYPC
jgi:hypothetical protein